MVFKKILLVIILIFLVGCDKDTTAKNEAITVNLSGENALTDIYNIYTEKDYSLNKYEPKEKLYKGIYIEEESGSFVQDFENFSGVSQSLYLKNMKLDESFPLSWVLGCYSNEKTSFITLLPPEDRNNNFDENLLLERAKEFGNLDIPIFLNIYPLNVSFLNSGDEYIDFIQTASGYFNEYAPNVSLIWSVPPSLVYEASDFYPGDNYIDWIGLNIIEDIDENNTLNIMFTELDFLYNEFANKKPIFLNIAISHFGNNSYSYNIESKIRELNRYYNEIPYKYPRIKMINYISYDSFRSEKTNKQNYLITDNKKILETYKTLLQNEIFTTNLSFTTSENISKQKEKAKIVCYKIDDDFFISANSYNDDTIEKTAIDGKFYYELDAILNKHNYKKLIDEINKNLIIIQN